MEYVIITGATGGIGKAFVEACAEEGLNLILIGRSIKKLDALKIEILTRFSSINVLTFDCDLSCEKSRSALYEKINSLDIKILRLINVAGVDTQKAFEKYTQEKLIFQSRVNFESVVSTTLFALKNNSNNLSVITISSMCAATPMPYFALYSATKAALVNFFKGIQKEYSKKSVCFTTVLPGSVPTRTDIIEDIEKQGLTGKLSKKTPAYVAKKSLMAAKRKKSIVIPGFYNKLVYFFSKITPYCITSKIIKKKFSIKEKDAF